MNEDITKLHAEGLHKLATSNTSVSIAADVAGHPNASPETIEHLLKSRNPMVQYRAINNYKTPAELLDSFKNDNDSSIRNSLAIHNNTSEETLHHLSKDTSWNVRYSVACNPNASHETLKNLSHDRFSLIRDRAHAALRDKTNPPEDYRKWMDDT